MSVLGPNLQGNFSFCPSSLILNVFQGNLFASKKKKKKNRKNRISDPLVIYPQTHNMMFCCTPRSLSSQVKFSTCAATITALSATTLTDSLEK